ncbi:rhomboid family intramembrane serine protease [Spongiivirga citrea]|uniref:Rhomboid family intramembrane serine protease n=2 Tax=Spongiivirga citrea TaxID=1481457 RepID=A0A6M0CHT1_9FLAO|nr:rhomboid family intramembrane serine protease [Spongiivirga citrea]NER16513.1 rhomboid family intramembrane serine protease [Spongiivirga citrea]
MNIDIATIAIIAITCLVSFKGFSDFSFFERYKFNVGALRRGEQVRMLSSGFLHADTVHLFFNMFTLYFFAQVVINDLGRVSFLLIYFGSLIAGNLLAFNFHKNEYHYSAIGASGAVTGVLYSAILLFPNMELYLFFIPIPITAWIFGILYLGFSIYGMKNRLGNIGHSAHFGGAIGGYALTLFMKPSLLTDDVFTVVVLAIPIIILFVLEKTGKLQ